MTGRRPSRSLVRYAGLFVAAALAVIPFAQGLASGKVFYIRDLSLYFWARHLWLRRAWLSGEFPLWDPFVGAGQAAHEDALHQMFFPPAIMARLIGGETLGFNLWLLLAFPVAATGAWLFFARRLSAPAATVGAIAFAVCGPVVATGNFPNLAWAVALMPWVLWAADLVVTRCTPRAIVALALTTSMQSLAGEPVTQFSTMAVAGMYALVFSSGEDKRWVWVGSLGVIGGTLLGLAMAAIQLLPMIRAAKLAQRAETIAQELWSLRPSALFETVWPHLYGNYYTSQSMSEVPWLPLMYTGREPLLFSIYLGIPLLSLAAYGLASGFDRRWRLFWVCAALAGLIMAFGGYTPLYPWLRDYVPFIGSFRFPVKYFVVVALSVAAGAATGWDALTTSAAAGGESDRRRIQRARFVAIGGPIILLGLTGAAVAACLWFPDALSTWLYSVAIAHGAGEKTDAPHFMVAEILRGAPALAALASATIIIMLLARRRPAAARLAIGILIACDLVARGVPLNPVFDAKFVAQPDWVEATRVEPHAKVYVGGKRSGTLDPLDFDGSRAFENAPGLRGSASRAALSTEAVFYPSAWGMREMLSYDLAVLWPRSFAIASEKFFNGKAEQREIFLDRTGVRYRVLPKRRAPGREPVLQLPLFLESFFFDWGEGSVAPRLSVVPAVQIEPDVEAQIAALFADGWDYTQMAYVDREIRPSGQAGAPAVAAARVLGEASNWLTVEASAGADGGYLILLDSYSEDWRVTVDGIPAEMARANALFRAVRLAPGTHTVEFKYRPRALWVGASISALALLACAGLIVANPGRKRLGAPEVAAAQ